MEKKRKKPVKLGDIYALQLPSGKFAFGRIFKESCIGIYTYFGTELEMQRLQIEIDGQIFKTYLKKLS